MGQKIFLSVGRTFTQQQEEFVSSLEEFMQGQGVIPQTVGRTFFPSQQPLKAVAELMEQCSGTIPRFSLLRQKLFPKIFIWLKRCENIKPQTY